jgi:hypothetical protein
MFLHLQALSPIVNSDTVPKLDITKEYRFEGEAPAWCTSTAIGLSHARPRCHKPPDTPSLQSTTRRKIPVILCKSVHSRYGQHPRAVTNS